MTPSPRNRRDEAEPTSPEFDGFGPRAVAFYEGLSSDNSRDYWQTNRAIWVEEVSEPMQALAEILAPEFGDAKIFRPHRDVRFTPDKRPYKENASMAVESGGGALYLQLSADGLMLAGGYYQPARDQLERFRDLQDDERATAALDQLLRELDDAGYPQGEGAPVKTAPRGRSREHPRIDLIRRTTLTVEHHREPGAWLFDGRCLDEVRTGWATIDRWNGWLASHVGPSVLPAREH